MRSEDGSYKLIYTPKVPGSYTVTALAPDGKGEASGAFNVENANQMIPASGNALNDLAHDVSDIISTARQSSTTFLPLPHAIRPNRTLMPSPSRSRDSPPLPKLCRAMRSRCSP